MTRLFSPMCRAACAALVLSLGLLNAGPAWTQSLPQSLTSVVGGGKDDAAKADAAASEDDPAPLRKALDQARADYAQATRASALPTGATPEEGLERTYLLGELVAVLERSLDVLTRLPAITQQAADQDEKTKAWTANTTPPSVSLIAVDHVRDQLADVQSRLKAATVRLGFLDQQVIEEQKRLKSSEVEARQADEKIAQAATEDQRLRLTWQRDLAKLRARVAAASIDEANATKRMGSQEILELRSLATLLQNQLDEMRRNEHFTQAELDSVLNDLDRKAAELEARRVRLQTSSAQSHLALEQAQRNLTEAKAANPQSDKIPVLERDVALQRLRADTDDMIYDLVRRQIEVRTWERTGWQYRWYLFTANTQDAQDKQREAAQNLSDTIQKLDGWNRYLRDEIARVNQQADGTSSALTAVQSKGDAAISVATAVAYKQRADALRDAQKAVDALLRTFRSWDDDLHADGALPSWQTLTGRIWDDLRFAARTVWNFELFAAEDVMDVEGRRVTAVRSVTVGKSLGVILLVLLGAVVSRRLLNILRALAVRHFHLPPDHARTMTRWLHIVIVAMLFIIALYAANIPLTVFAFLGGALAIGVGFGTQVILKNMISGVILLIERPLRVGDIIEVGSVSGTVTHINVRSSTVRTSDGIEILVPNSTFIENNVTNWTYSNSRVRRSVAVGADYGAAPEKVAEILMGVAHRHPSVLQDPAPCVLLDNFGADSINYILRYWIDYDGGADSSRIASDLRFMIAAAFTEAAIDIPLPQRVVHVKPKDAL